MFKRFFLILLLFNISFVFADSLIINSESEFNNGSYENTYFNEEFTYSETLEDSYTKLLMHLEDFTDEMGHTPSSNGDVSINSGKFLNGVYFDGEGDYINIPDSEDWNFGSSDFTIDFWTKFDDVERRNGLFGQWDADTNNRAVSLSYRGDNSPNQLRLLTSDVGNSYTNTYFDWSPNQNEWYHFALVRQGTNYNIYIDGNLIFTHTGPGTLFSSNAPFLIGDGDVGTGTPLQGSIDEFRVSKGIARWTSNFVPPNEKYYVEYEKTKTSVKISERLKPENTTKLLMHFDDFTDEMGHTPTANGNTNIGSGKFGSGACFDGSGDSITIPDSDDWHFGTENFTIDFWVYTGVDIAYSQIVGQPDHWAIVLNSRYPYFWTAGDFVGNDINFNGNQVPTNTWTHVAIVRENGVIKNYFNGVQSGSIGTYNTWHNVNSLLTIGLNPDRGGRDFNGCIDELRVVKGKAVWTSNFVPPTAEYPEDLTKLLLHFDGPDESQTHFYDSSSSDHTLTVNGNTKLESSEKMFGESSVYFDGTGDYIDISNPEEFDLVGNKFTIEFWTKIPSEDIGDTRIFEFADSTHTVNIQTLTYTSDGYGSGGPKSIGFFDWTSTNSVFANYTNYLDKWTHITITGDESNLIKIYLDGKLKNSSTISKEGSTPTALRIGASLSSVYFLKGYLDEIKITKGKVLYTSNFTPNNYQYYNNLNGLYQSQIFDMSSQVNWTNISWLSNLYEDIQIDSNTKLLLHFNNGDESTSFTDSSDSSHSITRFGDAKQENTQIKFGASSGYFDGTGDYLSIADSNDFNLGSEDFTIDFWTYPEAYGIAGYIYFLGQVGTWNSNHGWGLQWDTVTTNGITFYLSEDGLVGTSRNIKFPYNITLNAWTHIAITREENNLHCFANGELIGTKSITETIYNTNHPLEIGDLTTTTLAGTLDGYIDELRIVKGEAMWTENFTPPNQEYYKSNTKLLLQFDEGDESTNFIDSSNYNRTITSYGDVKQENTSKRFGTSAGYFDGNGDYLTLADSTDWELFAGGDFTLEGWVKHNSVGAGGSTAWDTSYFQHFSSASSRWVFGYGWDGASNNGLYFGIVNGGWTLYWMVPGNNGRILDTNWHHVALTKKGNTYYIFRDGKLLTSTTSVVSYNGNGNLYIGQRGNSIDFFDGYMDEFRVVKGEAKWTSNFEPPNEKYYSNLNEMEMKVKTCSNADCSDGVWTTNTDISSLSSQYIQFQTLFGTQDISFNPELFNVSLNYIISEPEITINNQYFVSPTPENKSNLMTNEVLINISSINPLSNCILHINSQDISMTNYGTYCTQNFSNFNLEVEDFYYNVSFTENSESKITENRMFTYYPDYSEEAMPSYGLISGLITILIIIGGLFI